MIFRSLRGSGLIDQYSRAARIDIEGIPQWSRRLQRLLFRLHLSVFGHILFRRIPRDLHRATVVRQEQDLKAKIAEQRKDFQSAITQQQKEMETVVAHLKEQDSKIQKVSDQLEVSKPWQIVVNNH